MRKPGGPSVPPLIPPMRRRPFMAAGRAQGALEATVGASRKLCCRQAAERQRPLRAWKVKKKALTAALKDKAGFRCAL